MKKILLNAAFILAVTFAVMASKPVLAVYCSSATNTIGSTCEYQYATDGYDDGGTTNGASLTLTSGVLQVGQVVAGQQLVVGKLILNGGAVVIWPGAKLNLGGKIWMLDRDADGYPASTTMTVSATQPNAYYRRKSAIKASVAYPLTVDCDDYNANVHYYRYGESLTYRTTAIADSALDGTGPSAKNGTFDYNCDAAISKQYNLNSQYSCDPTGCAAHYFTATAGWASGASLACGGTDTYYDALYLGGCNASNYDACPYNPSTLTQGCY